jgi:hypothetical protein
MSNARRVLQFREAKDLIRREQLFVHLCICAFVRHSAPTKPPKKNKYTKDTILWELFDNAHLCICLFVYSPTKSQPKVLLSKKSTKVKSTIECKHKN